MLVDNPFLTIAIDRLLNTDADADANAGDVDNNADAILMLIVLEMLLLMLFTHGCFDNPAFQSSFDNVCNYRHRIYRACFFKHYCS